MKNLSRKILLILCAAVLAFSFTACGKSEKDSADTTKEETTPEEDSAASEPEEDADDDSDIPASGKYATLEEFVNSDIMQEQLETQTASLEGTGISAAITAEGNKLIYNFTITDPDLAATIDAASLQSTLDSQASTYESIASTIPLAVEIDNPVVVVRYLDSAGTELASREFAPSAE